MPSLLTSFWAAALATTAPEIILLSSFEQSGEIRTSIVGMGTTVTHVNTPRYRQSAILSTDGYQYVAYYAPDEQVILARHGSNGVRENAALGHFGDVTDPHNVIVFGVDDCGYIHLAWSMHNHPLNYIRSTEPGALTFYSPRQMTGSEETKVTYPQFQLMPCLRQTSLTGRPASASFRIATIWDSLINRAEPHHRTLVRASGMLRSGQEHRHAVEFLVNDGVFRNWPRRATHGL